MAPEPERASREALDRWERYTASPVLGWLLAWHRGWAWLQCQSCGWWRVSGSDDLLDAWDEHNADGHTLGRGSF